MESLSVNRDLNIGSLGRKEHEDMTAREDNE